MSTIEIKAELDQTELLFEYRGSDLKEPLDRLYSHLMLMAADLSREAGTAAPLPTLSGLVRNGPEQAAAQRLRVCLSDAFEALLWAAEARRTPDKTWRLTMGRLKWLYRQNAPTS